MPETDDSKMYGALAYLLGILSGILVFLIKKEDKFAKFHAMQSILLGIALIVLLIALTIVAFAVAFIPIIGWLIGTLLWAVVGLGLLILWLLLMWKAYQGEKWKLPIIGERAEKMAASA